MDSHPERVPSDSEEKPPRMAAKTNEGGSPEASRRLASGEKGRNRAVRRKSDGLLGKSGWDGQRGKGSPGSTTSVLSAISLGEEGV